MARYWSDGYGETEQVGDAASYSVTVIDRVRWDGKQDKLYFDNTPTLGSDSPVTSDGIARALNEVREYVRQKDNELFYIDVVTQDGVETLRDKTYIDIYEAYKSGDTLILRFADSADKCAYFYDFRGNVFRFVLFEATDVLSMYTYWISPDDLLHVETYSAPYNRPNPETFAITYGENSVVYDGSEHASVNIPKVPAWALNGTKPKYTASEVGAEEKGVAASRVSTHNSNENAHADIRNMINTVVNMFNSYATQGQLQQVHNYTQTNAADINKLRNDAVLKKDIVDDLYTNTTVCPLSARQGMLLRSAVDKITPKDAGLLLWDGYSLHAQYYYVAVPSAHGMPIADEGGRLSTNTPADALHCANKQYVDDAVLSSLVITAKTAGTANVITNSAAVKPKNIKLFGKSEQATYQGNQLFDISNIVATTKSGVTIDKDGDYITINGTGTGSYIGLGDWACDIPSGTSVWFYVVEGDPSNLGFYLRDENKGLIHDFTYVKSVTLDKDAKYFRITCKDSTYNTKLKIMLSAKENAEWEPYVGGEASPSLSYRQGVVGVGQRLATGKQLLDYENSFEALSGFEVTKTLDGGLHIVGTNKENNVIGAISLFPPKDATYLEMNKTYTYVCRGSNKSIISRIPQVIDVHGGQQIKTFVWEQKAPVALEILVEKGASIDTILYPILVEGTVIPLHEPYGAEEGSAVDVNVKQTIYSGNICPKTVGSYTNNGVTFDFKGDHVVVKGTKPADVREANSSNLNVMLPIIKGTYYLPKTKTADVKVNMVVVKADGTKTYPTGKHTFDGTELFARLYVSVFKANTEMTVDEVIPLCVSLDTEEYKYDEYKEPQNLFHQTPNGLHGQGDVADVIDYGQGKRITRFIKIPFLPTYDWRKYDTNFAVYNLNLNVNVDGARQMCNACHNFKKSGWKADVPQFAVADNYIRFVPNGFTDMTLEDFKAHLEESEVYAICEMAEPIVTDLTEEEIAQYNAIHTNYPNTTIVNSDSAYTEVEYVADPALFIKDNYVDKAQHQALADRVLVLEQLALNL